MENPYTFSFLPRTRSLRQAGMAALLLGASLSAAPGAQVFFTGTGLDADWFAPGNWSSGALPTAADGATINNGADALLSGGTSTTQTLTVRDHSHLAVSGSTSQLNSVGIAINQPTLQVLTGTLSISNGALVTSGTGYASIGRGGSGVLMIDTGGTFRSGMTYLGYGAGDVGVATVSGPGSYMHLTDALSVGSAGSGTLTITNGGTVRTNTYSIVGGSGQGTVIVSGTGSTWNAGWPITLGFIQNGTGLVRVEDGGRIIGGIEVSTGMVIQTGGTISGVISFNGGVGTYRLEGGVLEGVIGDSAGSASLSSIELAGGTVRSLNGSEVTNQAKTTLREGTTTTLDFTAPSTISVWSGVISGAGELVKTGGGILSLTGSNTYSSKTTLTQGGILFGHNSALGSGTLAVNGNTSIGATGSVRTIANDIVLGAGFTGTIAGSSNLTLNGTISGDGTLRKINSSAVTLGGNNTYTGSTILSAGTLFFGHDNALSTGTLTITGNSSIGASGGSRTVANAVVLGSGVTASATGADHLELSGTLSGAGSLQTFGTGTLTLSAANSYTGTTTLAAGTLQIANAAAIASSSGLVFNGGTMRGNGTAYAFANALTFSGTAGFSGSSDLTFTGNGTLGTSTRTFDVANTGDTTFSGTISGSTLSGIIKEGAGTMILSGVNNTYSGTTIIRSGTLAVTSLTHGGANSSLGRANGISIGGTTTTGALRYIGSGDTSNRTITLSGSTGGAILDGSGSGALALTGAITSVAGSKTLTLAGTGTVENAIFGTISNGAGLVSLEKAGSGTWGLTGANTYTGATTISGGKLAILANENLGQTTSAVILGGATTSGTLSYRGQTTAYTRGFTVNAGGGGLEMATPGESIMLFEGGIATAGRFTISGPGHVTIASAITGTGSIQKAGSGNLVVSGSNSYSGGTTVTEGEVTVQNDNALGTGAVKVAGGTLSVGAGYAIDNTVVLSGGTYLRTVDGSLIDAANTTSDLGGVDTTARIAAGTTATARTLTSSFSPTTTALNDEIRRSDIYAFAGTGNDLFVLELSFSSTAGGSFVGWLGGDEWVNATDGNTGNNATTAMLNYEGTFADFQLEYGTTLENYIGAYGVDITDGVTTTWAVLNHNSDFSAIPEPGTVGLLAAGLAALALRRRRGARK